MSNEWNQPSQQRNRSPHNAVRKSIDFRLNLIDWCLNTIQVNHVFIGSTRWILPTHLSLLIVEALQRNHKKFNQSVFARLLAYYIKLINSINQNSDTPTPPFSSFEISLGGIHIFKPINQSYHLPLQQATFAIEIQKALKMN